MAGSRSSLPADGIVAALTRALHDHVAIDARVAIALSGGRDSVALFAAACETRPGSVVAIHVHHGLSAHADAWAELCTELTASRGVPLAVRHVAVPPGDPRGIEAAARHLRYTALREAARELGATAVLLAHHRDDQVETLLLQLLRGAGPHGLAAMPAAARDGTGLWWLRPLLDVGRSDVEAYVRDRGLRYVDDESNLSARHRRNALRTEVVPALACVFPGYAATLARAAAHQAEAARLIDELAELDAAADVAGRTLDCATLARLPPHRARNLLRWFLRRKGLRTPSARRLTAMLQQLAAPRQDARVCIAHDGAELGIFRGRIVVHAAPPKRYARPWSGQAVLSLPHGRLVFAPTVGEGVSAAKLAACTVVVRSRQGGERARFRADAPRRALKACLREAGLPEWERKALPLLFGGEVLVAVPGLGVDVAFQAIPDEPGYRLEWQPDTGLPKAMFGDS